MKSYQGHNILNGQSIFGHILDKYSELASIFSYMVAFQVCHPRSLVIVGGIYIDLHGVLYRYLRSAAPAPLPSTVLSTLLSQSLQLLSSLLGRARIIHS